MSRAAPASPLQITERDLQRTVVGMARKLGWTVYHTWLSARSQPGFPDLVLVRPAMGGRAGRVVFAELKSATGTVNQNQQNWLWLLASAGAEVYTWRPEHLREDIAAVLMADTRP